MSLTYCFVWLPVVGCLARRVKMMKASGAPQLCLFAIAIHQPQLMADINRTHKLSVCMWAFVHVHVYRLLRNGSDKNRRFAAAAACVSRQIITVIVSQQRSGHLLQKLHKHRHQSIPKLQTAGEGGRITPVRAILQLSKRRVGSCQKLAFVCVCVSMPFSKKSCFRHQNVPVPVCVFRSSIDSNVNWNCVWRCV